MWRCTFSRLGSAGSNKGKTTASILTGTVALWKPKTGVGHLRVDGVEQDYTFFGSDMSPELRAAVKEKTEFEFEVDNSAGHKPKAIKLRPLSNVNYKKAAKTLVAKQGASSQNENASSPASVSAKNEKGTDDSSASTEADHTGAKRMKEPPRRLTGTVKRIAGLGGFISVPGQNHDYFFHRKNLAQSVDFGNDMHIGTRVAFLGHTALNSYIATDVAPFEKSTSNTDGATPAKAEDAETVSGGLSRNDQAASLLACVDQQVRVTGRLSRFFMSATGGFIHIFGLRRDAVFNLTDVEDPTLLESANDPDRKDKIKMMDRSLRISFLLVSDSSARNRSGLRAVQIRRLLPDDDSIFRVESQDVQEGEQAKAAALGATTTTSGGADKPRSFVKEGYITSFDVGSGYGVISTFDRTPTVAPEERFHVFVLRNLSPDLRKLDTNHLVNQCVSFIETSTPQGKRGADDIVIAENPKSMDEIMAHRQWRKTAAHQPLPPAASSSASTTTSATAGEATAGAVTKSKLLRGTVEHYDTATRQGTIRWVDEEKNRNETLRFVNANAENVFNQGQSVVFRRVLGSAGSGDAAIQVQPFRHHGVVIGYNRMSQLSTKFHGFILPIETYRQLKDDAFFLTNPLDHGAIYFSSDYIQNTTQVQVVLGAHVLYEAHSQGEAKNYAATVFPRLRVEKAENLKPTGQRGADTVVKVPASLHDDCEAYLEGSDQDYVVKETTQCLERLRKASMMLTVARARKTLAQRRLRAADASEVADTAAAKGSSSAMTKPGGESFEKKTFRLRGTVSGFDRNKHYGFIEREGEPADHYFFRFDSAVVSRMHIGLPVEFYETDHSRPNHRRAYDIDFLFEESSNNNNKAKTNKTNATTENKVTSAAA